MTINERMKYLRKDLLHINSTNFGKYLGISNSGVSEIENGRRAVTDQHIKMLTIQKVEGHTISEAWLRTGEGEPFIEMSMEEELTELFADMLMEDDFVKKEVIKMLLMLPPDAWEVIRDEINRNLDKFGTKENPDSE